LNLGRSVNRARPAKETGETSQSSKITRRPWPQIYQWVLESVWIHLSTDYLTNFSHPRRLRACLDHL
jgi:hypothetical protein